MDDWHESDYSAWCLSVNIKWIFFRGKTSVFLIVVVVLLLLLIGVIDCCFGMWRERGREERERKRTRRKEKAERNTLFDSFGRCFLTDRLSFAFLILEKLNSMPCRNNDFSFLLLLLRLRERFFIASMRTNPSSVCLVLQMDSILERTLANQ